MTTKIPKLAEMHCSRIVFKTGDRILVKVFRDLSKDEIRKMRKAIEKWAGDGIPVLIMDARTMEIIVEPASKSANRQSARIIH